MIIVTQEKDTIVNLEAVSYLYSSYENNVVKAVLNNGKMVKLGRYQSFEEGKTALEKLYRHIGSTNIFEMPTQEEVKAIINSKTMYDKERCATGKKPVRRGGS